MHHRASHVASISDALVADRQAFTTPSPFQIRRHGGSANRSQTRALAGRARGFDHVPREPHVIMPSGGACLIRAGNSWT